MSFQIGILGRTNLERARWRCHSFFKFVEATESRIFVDGVDVSKFG